MSRAGRSTRLVWAVLIIVAVGAVLRSLRLNWQPLWWDEGYSVYFSTEAPARMAWLTAHDIHPPLYYALLHGWIGLAQSAAPVLDRTLSVLLGIVALPLQYWLGRALFPRLPAVGLAGLLLLAFSPLHLYYSQEVRMYGLALALGLLSSICFWLLVRRLDQLPLRRALLSWPALGYLLAATAGLYTLYYTALLLAGQLIWAAFYFRRQLRSLAAILGLDLAIALAYLPWVLYAAPLLIEYVSGKVKSDQDAPLGPLAYVERHLVAFTAGHVSLPGLPDLWMLAPATMALCALILGLVLLQTATVQRIPAARRSGQAGRRQRSPAPLEPDVRKAGPAIGALWTWLLVPIVFGWLINLRYPFFPAGGERLLLIVLPYFLLLIGYAIVRTWRIWHLGKLAAAGMAISALLGIGAYYTVPRYTADDYRPLLGQIVQQGANADTLLAIFPWQIGYWRAYTPQNQPAVTGPQPLLLSDGAVEWSPAVQAKLDEALKAGVLWFPEPLTFGSSLPKQIEDYLRSVAADVENRWYDATRLTAWLPLQPAPVQTIGADFGPIRLQSGGVAPAAAASANDPLAVTLGWQRTTPIDLNVSLRIQDKQEHVWSSREFELPAKTGAVEGGTTFTQTLGLIVPVGLPPGGYDVAVSVQTADGAPLTMAGSNAVAVPIGGLEVTQPETPQPVVRLPIQTPLDPPATRDGLSILGFAGANRPLMAGTELAVTLFLQNRSADPPDLQLYLSLVNNQGAGAAGYEGWPLPDYPLPTWPPGALTQVPVTFFVPGALATGSYRLVAGFLDPQTGEKTPPVELTRIQVNQRMASFTRPTPAQPLPTPVQFGTHARLLGYELATDAAGVRTIRLYWEILQPLLPPNHIFVHADDAQGHTVAQQDGPPQTVDGPAPTGSWQPGEFLTTVHTLPATPSGDMTIRVGLYDPETGVRLPATIDDQPAGDNVVLK